MFIYNFLLLLFMSNKPNLNRVIVLRFQDEVIRQINRLDGNMNLRQPIKEESTLRILNLLSNKIEGLIKLCGEFSVDPLIKIYLKEMRDAIILFRLNEMELSTFIQIKEKVAKNLTELI